MGFSLFRANSKGRSKNALLADAIRGGYIVFVQAGSYWNIELHKSAPRWVVNVLTQLAVTTPKKGKRVYVVSRSRVGDLFTLTHRYPAK